MVGQNQPSTGEREWPTNQDWPTDATLQAIPHAAERIPVTARVVWPGGTVQHVEGTAVRWSGRRVHVELFLPERGGVLHVWLNADDVRRDLGTCTQSDANRHT